MKNLWGIRMRASKNAGEPCPGTGGRKEIHISGAEGLYSASDIPVVLRRYIDRALKHPKGKPEKVVLTAELIKQYPRIISALPVCTVICKTPNEGKTIAQEILMSLGITEKAVHAGHSIISKGGMRGAAIVSAMRGVRLEPDRQRGVRVSRLGISRSASKLLSARLSRHGINTDTVKEALLIASKVISHQDVIAELCVSDDPDYTTGYVASEKFGYVRIPHIKWKRTPPGGRALFVRDGADIPSLILYLETMPVIIGRTASCRGALTIYEILHNPDR
jgi:6-carboxyhexanoate--CoA ligase